MTPLQHRLGLAHPILLAPMAGGPSTPALAAAVSQAGGLGSLAGAFDDAATLRIHIARIRAATTKPFAVNLFLDPGGEASAFELARTRALLKPAREKFGLPVDVPPKAPPNFDAQLAVVMDERPAVFSSTFGAPPAEMVRDAQARSILVMGTATTPDEADVLLSRGVDAVVAQGSEAGGHRGTFLHPIDDALIGVLALVTMIAKLSDTPVIAAGGLMTGAAVAGVLAAGAQAAALGTAFLLCPEAGTPPPFRALLASPRAKQSTLTRAFSGRWGRGLPNTFTRIMAGVQEDLAPFPVLGGLTGDLRRAAVEAGDGEYLALFAGQGAPLARAMPAAELVTTLATEMQAAQER